VNTASDAIGSSPVSYVDVGISGTKEKRPELDRLLSDAHHRRFDAVAVWRFDRFARSVSHLLRALETFRALGIEFVSLSEQVDTSTPTGKMGTSPAVRYSSSRQITWSTSGLERRLANCLPKCPLWTASKSGDSYVLTH
jgi:hypothetical protein